MVLFLFVTLIFVFANCFANIKFSSNVLINLYCAFLRSFVKCAMVHLSCDTVALSYDVAIEILAIDSMVFSLCPLDFSLCFELE